MRIFALKTTTFVQILCRTEMKARHYSILISVLMSIFLIFSCGEVDRYVAVTGYAQGGTYSVKLNLRGCKIAPEQLKISIDSILTLVDTTLSGYNKGSQLSRFNAGESIVPNSLFEDIYSYCHRLYEETDGHLDVASGPLFDLWGFGFSNDSLPDSTAVAKVREACGMARLKPSFGEAVDADGRLDPRNLLVSADDSAALPKLNFNAVAQGYTCDLVASYLHNVGVKDMLVNIGEIYCEGLNPSGLGWTIAVDRPVDGNETPGEDIDGIWNSEGEAVGIVTSGNYRKFYIRDGKKYAHTINPLTGYPVDHQLLSATILAPDAATADAYATYCMVIGLEAAKQVIESSESLEGYLIYGDGSDMQEWASEGFKLTSNL